MGSINKDHPGSTTQKTLENYILESTRSIFFTLPFSIISKTPTVGGDVAFCCLGGMNSQKMQESHEAQSVFLSFFVLVLLMILEESAYRGLGRMS